MRKLVLPLLMLVGYTAANAQVCVPGYSATGIYDNFTAKEAPSNGVQGLYHWGDTLLAGDLNPEFIASPKRNPVTGMLDAVITQGKGKYVPFGIGFGDSNGALPGGSSYSIDLTSDKTFKMKVKNSSATVVKVRLSLQDTSMNVIDTYAAADPATIWTSAIEIEVAANGLATLEGTFAGAGQAVYGPKGDNTDNLFITNKFNFKAVSTILITVFNSLQDAADGYKTLPIAGVAFSVDEIQLGVCPKGSAVNTISTGVTANVYPNPTSDVANVTMNLNQVSSVNISVVDMFGRTVKEVVNGKFSNVNEQVNVSGLAQGVYTVNYVVDGATAKSTLLMVK